jgi:sucrose-phosphate synthase
MHPDFGGQLVYVKEIAIALGKSGHQVDIFTRLIKDSNYPEFQEPFDYYPNHENVRIVRIPCGGPLFLQKELLWEHLREWSDNIIDYFKIQNKIPDFLTGHYGDGGLACAIIKERLNIPYSLTGHSLGAQKFEKLYSSTDDLHELEIKYHFSKRILAERTAIHYADLIFVSTIQERDEQYHHILYQDITIHKNDQFIVAAPGANTTVFSNLEQPSDTTFFETIESIKVRDINDDRQHLPFILLASRLDPKKNHVGLMKAYASDLKLQNRANVAISLRGIPDALKDYSHAKDSEKIILDEIMDIIKVNRLEGKVMFIDIRSQFELSSLYRYMAKQHSIFTLTALYEPFGLAPIEAMACGLPAVVTKYGGPSDVLLENDERYGILIDVLAPQSVISGLHECLDNYDYFQKQAYKRVITSYTWDATALKYANAIKKLLASKTEYSSVVIPHYFLDPTSEKPNPMIILHSMLKNKGA